MCLWIASGRSTACESDFTVVAVVAQFTQPISKHAAFLLPLSLSLTSLSPWMLHFVDSVIRLGVDGEKLDEPPSAVLTQTSSLHQIMCTTSGFSATCVNQCRCCCLVQSATFQAYCILVDSGTCLGTDGGTLEETSTRAQLLGHEPLACNRSCVYGLP